MSTEPTNTLTKEIDNLLSGIQLSRTDTTDLGDLLPEWNPLADANSTDSFVCPQIGTPYSTEPSTTDPDPSPDWMPPSLDHQVPNCNTFKLPNHTPSQISPDDEETVLLEGDFVVHHGKRNQNTLPTSLDSNYNSSNSQGNVSVDNTRTIPYGSLLHSQQFQNFNQESNTPSITDYSDDTQTIKFGSNPPLQQSTGTDDTTTVDGFPIPQGGQYYPPQYPPQMNQYPPQMWNNDGMAVYPPQGGDMGQVPMQTILCPMLDPQGNLVHVPMLAPIPMNQLPHQMGGNPNESGNEPLTKDGMEDSHRPNSPSLSQSRNQFVSRSDDTISPRTTKGPISTQRYATERILKKNPPQEQNSDPYNLGVFFAKANLSKEGSIPEDWKVLRPRPGTDFLQVPHSPHEIQISSSPARSPNLLPSFEALIKLLSSVSLSKKDSLRMEKSKKLLSRLPGRHEQDLAHYKEKSATKLKHLSAKFEAEKAKIGQGEEKQLRLLEKQAAKLTNTGSEYMTSLPEINKQTLKIQNSTKEQWTKRAKELKVSQAESYAKVQRDLKARYDIKSRKKSYSKKEQSRFKLEYKMDLLMKKKSDLLDTGILKCQSDGDCFCEQQVITFQGMSKKVQKANLTVLLKIFDLHSSEFNQYNQLVDKTFHSITSFNQEEMALLRERHQFELDLHLKRFKAEEEHHETILSIVRQDFALSAGESVNSERESELLLLQNSLAAELRELQEQNYQQLQERFDKELIQLEYAQHLKEYSFSLSAAKRRVELIRKFFESERELIREQSTKERTLLSETQANIRNFYQSKHQLNDLTIEQDVQEFRDILKKKTKSLDDPRHVNEKINEFLSSQKQKLEDSRAEILKKIEERQESELKVLADHYNAIMTSLVCKFKFESNVFQNLIDEAESQKS